MNDISHKNNTSYIKNLKKYYNNDESVIGFKIIGIEPQQSNNMFIHLDVTESNKTISMFELKFTKSN